ncbi:O-antigen ligase family protein [Vibrio cholerae]|nr:O-antigen ligase family protein [Vibrio cholerae]
MYRFDNMTFVRNGKVKIILDCIFAYLPFFVSFLLIFNIPDTKYIWSRVVICSIVYLFIFHFDDFFIEIKSKGYLVVPLLIFCLYFFFMQYYNDGNSNFPRILCYIVLYFIALPSRLIHMHVLKYMLVLGALLSSFVGLYEFFILGSARVGFYVLNPIPISFYFGLLLIFSVWLSFESYKKNNILCGLSIVSSLLLFICIILTETRASWMALVIVCLSCIVYSIFNSNLKKKSIYLSSLLAVIIGFGWNIPIVHNRIYDAYYQIEQYKNDNYNSSTGIRIKLWQAGLDMVKQGPLLGLHRVDVQRISNVKIQDGEYPKFLRSFLIHPNPNFHNQYVQNLVNSGFIGLLFLIVFIFLPILVFIKTRKKNTMLISCAIIQFSLISLFFDSMFLYSHVVILYCSIIMVIYYFSCGDYEKK